MKITKLEDINLSDYKIARADWECRASWMSYETQAKIADVEPMNEFTTRIFLIPKNKRIQDCWWDDWNDNPADCNAWEPYDNTLPKWSIILRWCLGWELKIEKIID